VRYRRSNEGLAIRKRQCATTRREEPICRPVGEEERSFQSCPVVPLSPAESLLCAANDRESQRAIRERTKHQIETLERRVQELESGEAYQRLESVVREREELRAENEDIKARLTSVLAIVQPILGIGIGIGAASSTSLSWSDSSSG